MHEYRYIRIAQYVSCSEGLPPHPDRSLRPLAAIQDAAASIGAKRRRRQSDRCMLPTYLHSHTSNTHTAGLPVLFHTWQSLETQGKIVKIASSSESSDGDDHLMLFCCWCLCCSDGELRKGVQKEERFGVGLTLKYRHR